jgi:hypothetical protein
VAGNIDPQVRRQNELTEATTTVGSVFLGLTVGCARCHDHKFDAFPTTDYYRLQSYFEGAVLDEILLADRTERAAFDEAKQALDARIKPLKDALAKLEASYREKLKAVKQAGLTPLERAVMATPEDERTPVQKKLAEGVKKALTVAWEEVAEAVSHNAADHAERERLKRAIHDVEVTLPPPPARAMAMVEKDRRSPETFVLTRGDAKHRGARVEPRPPGVLLALLGYPDVASARKRTIAVPPCCATTSGRRRELAAWLTHPRNALVARVIVNRLWQHHFGLGIVATPSDFGVRGEPPSHPELLDWLARELTERSFSLKALHRMIVLSSTYRQSSHDVDPQLSDGDPENQLLGRMRRRRMEAEGIRDAFLEVSGRLQSKMGGPGIRPPIENEVRALIFTEAEVVDLWPETPDPSEHARRSLYLYRKRNVRYPLFDAFDAPDTQISCPRREVSTHALQPLVLLNSAFAIDCAKAFAGRLLAEARTPRQRMDRAYQISLGRSPTPAELDQALNFLHSQAVLLQEQASHGQPLASPRPAATAVEPAAAAAWVDFCLAMLNCDEFLVIP